MKPCVICGAPMALFFFRGAVSLEKVNLQHVCGQAATFGHYSGKRLKVISNSKWKWVDLMSTEVRKDERRLHASDSYGEFSEEFIAEVLEAEKEAEMGLGKRFDNVDDLIADLLDD